MHPTMDIMIHHMHCGKVHTMKRKATSALGSAAAPSSFVTKRSQPGSRRSTVNSKQNEAADAAGETVVQAQVEAAAAAAADGLTRYHDEEWGRPLHDDNQLFELLVLEGAQAGLSWSTILAKREAYRTAFEGFVPAKVAAFDDARVEALLAEGSGVVRHRGKLASAVANAKVVLRLQQEHGSLNQFVWSFVPNSQPIINSWTQKDQVPSKTPEAEALSSALKKAGMKFVGPTTCYAFMQAAGLVNDHTMDCYCYKQINDGYQKHV